MFVWICDLCVCVQVRLPCLHVPQKLRFRSACPQQTGVWSLVISDNLNRISNMMCAEVCCGCGTHLCMDVWCLYVCAGAFTLLTCASEAPNPTLGTQRTGTQSHRNPTGISQESHCIVNKICATGVGWLCGVGLHGSVICVMLCWLTMCSPWLTSDVSEVQVLNLEKLPEASSRVPGWPVDTFGGWQGSDCVRHSW